MQDDRRNVMSLTRQGRQPVGPLLKADRPRGIDRYIDYFGDPRGCALDLCGEELLDALADELPATPARAS